MPKTRKRLTWRSISSRRPMVQSTRKPVDKVLKDREVLLTHFDFPVEHWIHLRTTNVIESTFATVRLRTNKTKGAGSRSAGLAMAYKLLDAAQVRWRCVNAPTWSHAFALRRLSWKES